MSAAFLRIPPFPRHRGRALSVAAVQNDRSDPAEVIGALRVARVGGAFWGIAPALPPSVHTIVAPGAGVDGAADLAHDAAVVAPSVAAVPAGALHLPAECDPWALAGSGRKLRVSADHDLALVAALAGADVTVEGGGRFAGCDEGDAALAKVVSRELLERREWRSPFTGAPMCLLLLITQLGEWRALIEANRTAAAICGVAGWKRVTLDALLWDGSGPVRYSRDLPAGAGPGTQVLSWKSRTPPALLARLERCGATVGEIEDGMIRSVGLGANCVPPLSVIADRRGIYFDPSQPSELEHLLETAEIGPGLCRRAAALRETLVAQAISKYGCAEGEAFPRPANRRLVLVAGQVADDRSMLTGGMNCSNLDLIRRCRSMEDDAFIVYKPHPDVESGHRKGRIADEEVLRHADAVVRDRPITALLDAVDAVHVITSLTGFEGLLRGKQVTTHGVPFYAGWGLTRDMGDVPARRTRRRSLDELVAATLLLYPRYLDPVTRLPCPAEVLVARIAAGEAEVSSPLVALRTLQGRANRVVSRLAGDGR